MRKIFQKFDTFKIIFVIFGLFFSFTLFLSIPAVFDYKSLETKIEKKVESNFNFNLDSVGKIKYRFFPYPHLIFEKSNLFFDNNIDTKISTLKDAKIFISLLKLYNKKISIKRIELSDENFNLNLNNSKKIINHLYNFKNKQIKIKRSKLFYRNYNNEVIAISPVDKFFYSTNLKSNQKKLKIIGNIFDTNYTFNWSKDLNSNDSNLNLKFKNPNINFENKINTKSKGNKFGTLKTNFLDNNFETIYIYNKENLEIKSNNNSQNRVQLDGNIEFNPFFFDIKSSLRKQNINFLIKSILLNYFNYKDNVHQNLSGYLTLHTDNINNAFFSDGFLKFHFNNSKIILENNLINLTKIGSIEIKENLFYEDKGNVYFITKLQLNVKNQDEFYRRFLISKKKRVKLDKVFLIIEKNIDTDDFYLIEFSLSDNTKTRFILEDLQLSERIYFNNFQRFRNIIQNEF